MKRRIVFNKQKKDQYIGFSCEENLFMFIEKTLKNQKPLKYESASSLIRACIRKALPELAKDVGVEVS